MTQGQREVTALVVDDYWDTRALLSYLLNKNFPVLKVDTTSTAEEAYEMIGIKRPDILITDLLLFSVTSGGVMTGDSLLERLLSDSIRIPTIIVSGSTETPQFVKAVYYSHMMYTKEQREILQFPPLPNDIDEQRSVINNAREEYKILLQRRLQAPRDSPREAIRCLEPNFGFTVMSKPVDYKNFVDRIGTILDKLYTFPRILTSPQS